MRTDLLSLMLYGALLRRLGVKQIGLYDIPIKELQICPD